MNLNLNVPKTHSNLTPRLAVIGVGGAGGNAVNNMIHANLEGVEFLVANTDSQALSLSLCERCIQMGRNVTQGLGAGSRPDIGRAAAEEALDEILGELDGANMVFVTAGMGGGTGTGAAPVIARAAREAGILTVGVVTKPFHFEGARRMQAAEEGIEALARHADMLIVIPNQNFLRAAHEKTTLADAFREADHILHAGVRGVSDLVMKPGLINLDFADIRVVIAEMGKAMMGTGEAEGEGRAIAAAEAAISNPLLDDVSMKGARGVLINITGGPDLTLYEIDEAANRIRDEVDPEANIIFGSTFDERMEGRMRISVVATGIEAASAQRAAVVPMSLAVGAEPPAPEPPAAPGAPAYPRLRTAPRPPAGDPAGEAGAAPIRPAPEPVSGPEAGPAGADPAGVPDSGPAGEDRVEDGPPIVRYVVWDRGFYTQIFRVPLEHMARARSEPHARSLSFFETLDQAKEAAEKIFARVSAERRAMRLSTNEVEGRLAAIARWRDDDLPQYFI